jgi:hypothetical protein
VPLPVHKFRIGKDMDGKRLRQLCAAA